MNTETAMVSCIILAACDNAKAKKKEVNRKKTHDRVNSAPFLGSYGDYHGEKNLYISPLDVNNCIDCQWSPTHANYYYIATTASIC